MFVQSLLTHGPKRLWLVKFFTYLFLNVLNYLKKGGHEVR
jgi:hypothetical protein